MNNLVNLRKKIKRADRLHQAKLIATKNGRFIKYKPSVFEERRKQAQKDLNIQE